MSRIGKLPIQIPQGVTITVDSDAVRVQGPKGELEQFLLPEVKVKAEDGQVLVERIDDSKLAKSRHGLMRSLINNMVIGVTEGFSKKLEIKGVGFRLEGGGRDIQMSLGFSHPIKYQAPEGIDLKVEKMNLTVSGVDKQKVGQVAAEIRAFKKPEPYKGKGIRYEGEQIIRKAGKAGAK
ncbi:MAG TPA: 50S ribosomal protein L6 [Candidatus Saccharimonadales bacterium]|nr:50S ribosomal protein L6 [Candidatus Saccharimonadales bacterium]